MKIDLPSDQKLETDYLLMQAIYENDFPKATRALESKIDINARGYLVRAVQQYSSRLPPSRSMITYYGDVGLSLRDIYGDNEGRFDFRILQLLIDYGIDINEVFGGMTALHVASSFGGTWGERCFTLIEFLLRNGADYELTIAEEAEQEFRGKTAKQLLCDSDRSYCELSFKDILRKIASHPHEKCHWDYPPVAEKKPVVINGVQMHKSLGVQNQIVICISHPDHDERIANILKFYASKCFKHLLVGTHQYVIGANREKQCFYLTMENSEPMTQIFAQHTEELFDRAYQSVEREPAAVIEDFYKTNLMWKEILASTRDSGPYAGMYYAWYFIRMTAIPIKTIQEKQQLSETPKPTITCSNDIDIKQGSTDNLVNSKVPSQGSPRKEIGRFSGTGSDFFKGQGESSGRINTSVPTALPQSKTSLILRIRIRG